MSSCMALPRAARCPPSSDRWRPPGRPAWEGAAAWRTASRANRHPRRTRWWIDRRTGLRSGRSVGGLDDEEAVVRPGRDVARLGHAERRLRLAEQGDVAV